MKKIIYLSIVDISDKNGQGIYALKTLESFLKQKDVFVEAYLPFPKDKKVLSVFEKYNNKRFNFLNKKKKNRNIFWHFAVQMQLFVKLMMLGKRDALVYSLKPMMLAPVLYSKIFKVPVYLLIEGLAKNTVKTLSSYKIVGKLGEFMLNYNIKNSKRAYPAYTSAKEWIDNVVSNSNSKIINCGVDLNIFLSSQQKNTKKLTIGYVGSFRQVHLILELIKASKKIELEIYLIGNGEEKYQVEKYIEEKNLKNVHLLGNKEQNELVEYFNICDIMWAATDINHWGIPIKCFEYLASNKKVIYTKREDFNFIDENNYGYQLNNTDIKSISNLLKTIYLDYKNGSLTDNVNSRDYIIKNNDWNNFAKVIMEDINNDS